MSILQGTMWQNAGSLGLGRPYLYSQSSYSPHDHFLGQALLAACSFSQVVFHIPDISNS